MAERVVSPGVFTNEIDVSSEDAPEMSEWEKRLEGK